ncbi:MAG: PP2C family protein-serine/threonine phosphatase [Aggregatilineales bacterium]
MGFFRRLFKQPDAAAPTVSAQPANSATLTPPPSLPPSELVSASVNTPVSAPAEVALPEPPEIVVAPPGTPVDVPTPLVIGPAGAPELIEMDPMLTPVDLTGLGPQVTRPLPPLENYTVKPGKRLIYGLTSDIGQTRTNNQDSLLAFFGTSISVEERPDLALFAVADGMGGHNHGEKASAVAVRTIGQQLISKLYLTLLVPTENEANVDKPTISEMLNEAIQKANAAVSEQVPEGGTTLTVAAIIGDMVYIGHVGDSRAYLIAGETIEQITRDHSLVQRLVELDQLTPEEAAAHQHRNVLYRAIGQTENLEVDALVRRLPPNSRLLLCSDGLWNLVSEDMLLSIVRGAETPQEACDRLIEVANQRGGLDNITALLIQAPG